MHKHIKKHVKKHERKYRKFILFSSILVLFNVIEHIIAIRYLSNIPLVETILSVFVLAIIFTIVEEGFEKYWKLKIRKLKI